MMGVHPSPVHDPLGCETCPVRDIAVCAGLADQERNDLARLGKRRRFQRGETVFSAGDRSMACATLVSGALKLSRFDSQGVERTVALLHPAGFLARLFATEIDSSAVALTDSELCLFPRDLVEREMRSHPGFMERILQATTDQLASAHNLLDLIGRREARSRVAGLILVLLDGHCDSPIKDGIAIDLPLTRGEMATVLGLTIETVSRQLSALEAGGIISKIGLRGLRIDRLASLHVAAD